ncbi:DUF5984 family protein [Streptomyces sp. NPDC020802]|uniref:DUF5984 family protein n=1 Tax=Streptomyces sp. NPDC020802 TaxID=3365094 RepID=UPI0037B03DB9
MLRNSERTVQTLRNDSDGREPHPNVDHYVVRLGEDVIALVPEAVQSMPENLVGVRPTPHRSGPGSTHPSPRSQWPLIRHQRPCGARGLLRPVRSGTP